MATSVKLLNLDPSFPVYDAYYDSGMSLGGTIRFVSAADANKLPAINRLQGDIVNRFKLIENKINEVISAASNGILVSDTFDGSIYSRVDGSMPFLSPVSGVDPSQSNHLTTKSYVDDVKIELNRAITEFSDALNTVNETSIHYSGWVTHAWQAGVKQVVSIPILPQVTDADAIANIVVLEKINVSIPTVGNPDPEPRYIVRPITIGTMTPFGVDDVWYESNAVKIAIPNTAFYTDGYDPSYKGVQSVSFRQLRAVVTLIK
jgi:hypothetical protein